MLAIAATLARSQLPLADQLGALRQLQIDGKIGQIGLSEITLAELDEARQIIDVVSVQNRFSLLHAPPYYALLGAARAGLTDPATVHRAAARFPTHTRLDPDRATTAQLSRAPRRSSTPAPLPRCTRCERRTTSPGGYPAAILAAMSPAVWLW